MKQYVIRKTGGLYLTEVEREEDESQTEYLWTEELSRAKRFDEKQAMLDDAKRIIPASE